MGEIVSQARVVIDCSQGSIRLRRCKSFSIEDKSTTELVTAVGEEFAAGFRDKPGGVEISLEVFVETNNPEVDYQALKDAKEPFALTKQDVGGEREQYRPCRIADISKKGDDQGDHMKTIKIVAIRRVGL